MAAQMTGGTYLNDQRTPENQGAGDPDTGPNGFQNFPVVTQAVANPDGTITVSGTLDTTATTNYTIELFESKSCSNGAPSGRQVRNTVGIFYPLLGQDRFGGVDWR